VPTITVVIPLYNKRLYVKRALDSVCKQTFEDLEVIVVDDGSTDGGPEIVKAYSDPRIRLIRQDNAGPGAARNRGIREGTAPYVTFLDADDEWLPFFLESSYVALRQNPDCDLCVSSRFVDRFCEYASGRVDMTPFFLRNGITQGAWQVHARMPDWELKHVLDLFYTGAILSKRDVIGRYGGFYSVAKCSYGEDYVLWLKLAFNQKVYRNLTALVHYHNAIPGLDGGGYKARELEPFMLHPELVLHDCKPANQLLLKRWLTLHAIQDAHNRASVGKFDDVRYLLKRFPMIRRNYQLDYFKLRTKLAISTLCGLKSRVTKFGKLSNNV